MFKSHLWSAGWADDWLSSSTLSLFIYRTLILLFFFLFNKGVYLCNIFTKVISFKWGGFIITLLYIDRFVLELMYFFLSYWLIWDWYIRLWSWTPCKSFDVCMLISLMVGLSLEFTPVLSQNFGNTKAVQWKKWPQLQKLWMLPELFSPFFLFCRYTVLYWTQGCKGFVLLSECLLGRVTHFILDKKSISPPFLQKIYFFLWLQLRRVCMVVTELCLPVPSF